MQDKIKQRNAVLFGQISQDSAVNPMDRVREKLYNENSRLPFHEARAVCRHYRRKGMIQGVMMDRKMSAKIEWAQTRDELCAAVEALGFPAELGDACAKHLGSPKAMRRKSSWTKCSRSARKSISGRKRKPRRRLTGSTTRCCITDPSTKNKKFIKTEIQTPFGFGRKESVSCRNGDIQTGCLFRKDPYGSGT